MLAIRLDQTGGPEVLKAVDLPLPDPGEGEVRVRHEAVGVNFIDTYQRKGLYPLTLPSGLGSEAAGVVEAIGPGVSEFSVGDRVAYATGPLGAYAEAHVVPTARLVPVPAGVSLDVAAAGLLKGMTVEMLLLRCAPVKAGDTILVHAAAGGVGSILVQWAKAIGCTVIGTVGSEAKAELARGHGVDHIVFYDREDVAARVRDITSGAGVRVAYDSVGAATADGSIDSLARRGVFVSFGNASGPAPAIEPLRLMRAGSLFMTRPTLFDYVATQWELRDSAARLFGMIAAGKVSVPIGQRFAVKDAGKAHHALESRATTGSTVLVP